MTTAYGAGDIPEIMLRHRLRIAREHIGLEQGELAERMGVSRNTISAAEKGKNEPRVKGQGPVCRGCVTVN